jgi:hypothetical protein
MKKVAIALISSLLLVGGQALAQQFDYHKIDVRCDAAPCPLGLQPGETAQQTLANSINPGGKIVGAYVDTYGKQYGFLLQDGHYATVAVPGKLAGVTGWLPTSANGINPAGDIVGSYRVPVNESAGVDPSAYCPADPKKSAACIKGFVYHHGQFTTVLYSGHPGAVPQRISPDGDIYGCLHDYDLGMSMFGAIWSRSGAGEFSLMTAGGELADTTMMEAMSMNNGATPDGHIIVGLFTENKHTQGFRVINGEWSAYNVPNSIATTIWDMAPGGAFVGTYVDSTGHRFGFLQLPDDSDPIQLHFEDSTTDSVTTNALGINPAGVIVGQYQTVANGPAHGYYAVPLAN